MGPVVNGARSLVRPAQGTAFDRRELTDGKVSGETPGSIVFLRGTPGWVGGSTEQAHRRAWWTVVVTWWRAGRLQLWQAPARMALPLW